MHSLCYVGLVNFVGCYITSVLNKSKIAKGCMDIAMPYLNERTQFGTKLADFQVSTEVLELFVFAK